MNSQASITQHIHSLSSMPVVKNYGRLGQFMMSFYAYSEDFILLSSSALAVSAFTGILSHSLDHPLALLCYGIAGAAGLILSGGLMAMKASKDCLGATQQQWNIIMSYAEKLLEDHSECSDQISSVVAHIHDNRATIQWTHQMQNLLKQWRMELGAKVETNASMNRLSTLQHKLTDVQTIEVETQDNDVIASSSNPLRHISL